jgi:hypothetical protein
MTQVSMSTQVNASPDQVWRLIGGFDALPDWLPLITCSETSEGGRLRHVTLADGAVLVERLLSFSESDRSYAYAIVGGPIPVANYRATLRVRPQAGQPGSVVDWASEFEPAGAPEADVVALIRGVFQAGFDQLGKVFPG